MNDNAKNQLTKRAILRLLTKEDVDGGVISVFKSLIQHPSVLCCVQFDNEQHQKRFSMEFLASNNTPGLSPRKCVFLT